jgi:hypothetical protein
VNRVGVVVADDRPMSRSHRANRGPSLAALPDSKVTRSWKDIANYLKGSVKTVQRSEALAPALKIKKEELQRVVTADRIRVKFWYNSVGIGREKSGAGTAGKGLESSVARP